MPTSSVFVRPNVEITVVSDGSADKPQGPVGLFWLGGFMSDMQGSKATALADLAIAEGRPCTRFDYSGHGKSGGAFAAGTISEWLEEAIEVFCRRTSGKRVIVGSSMGGWLAVLLYRHLAKARPDDARRISGLVLLAPALDMTSDLMWNKYDQTVRDQIKKEGSYCEPSEYSPEPYLITRKLIEDGYKHLVLDEGTDVTIPVRILQGEDDRDVIWQHGLKAYLSLRGDDVIFQLIKGADHRLSDPANLFHLKQTCIELFALAEDKP